jgi:hypothetical protein
MELKKKQVFNGNDLTHRYLLVSSSESNYYSDFLFGTNMFSVYLNGVLNTTLGGDTDLGGHPGQVVLTTGTSASGEGRISTPNLNNLYLNSALVIMETCVLIPTLGSSAQEYEVNFGLGTSAKDLTRGVFFYYNTQFTGSNWIAWTKNNDPNYTSVNTGINVIANTWYRLSLAIFTNRAIFFINGSVVATITVNIPINDPMMTLISIEKWVGTTARILNVDYLSVTLRPYIRR